MQELNSTKRNKLFYRELSKKLRQTGNVNSDRSPNTNIKVKDARKFLPDILGGWEAVFGNRKLLVQLRKCANILQEVFGLTINAL